MGTHGAQENTKNTGNTQNTLGNSLGTVGFRAMRDGTRDDYALLLRYEEEMHKTLAPNILTLLEGLKGSFGGYQVSRYEHSLQSATRAVHDNADSDMIVTALLHDIGDVYAPANHAQLAAAILRPYVNDECYYVVLYHGLYQEYYYAHHYDRDPNGRDVMQEHRYHQSCIDFCEKYDQSAFDPDYDTMPLSYFIPMVREVFARSPQMAKL
ncbi:MAG: hypothetical protein AAF352_03320 [Pseudomonadota bacterium]